jgi:hypothetical protein
VLLIAMSAQLVVTPVASGRKCRAAMSETPIAFSDSRHRSRLSLLPLRLHQTFVSPHIHRIINVFDHIRRFAHLIRSPTLPANHLGEFESGMTAALFGAVPAAVLGGVGTIVIALLWMKLFPTLRNVERLE